MSLPVQKVASLALYTSIYQTDKLTADLICLGVQKQLRRGRNRGGARVAWENHIPKRDKAQVVTFSDDDDDRRGRQRRGEPKHPVRGPS
jgi:hypothetical protein